MPEAPGVGDQVDAGVERRRKTIKIEIEMDEQFQIPFQTLIQAMKEQSKIITSWRVR